MRLIYKIPMLLVFIFFSRSMNAQMLHGIIVDKATQESLPGATVYIDGTTISTITDSEGNFTINTKGNNNTLAVSFIGYSTYRLENPLQYKNKKVKILLESESINLDEVVIGKGPFSRKQMMKVFKEQFLGTSKAGKSCKIENENDIVLSYDITNNTLTATSRNPLKIKNNHLDYEINFDLVELVLNYKTKSIAPYDLTKSYFSGSTFYKDISKNAKKSDKKRQETYLGSISHFMNTLANENWERENLKLFVDAFQVNPKDYFAVKDTLGIKKVTLVKEPQKTIKDLKVDTNALGKQITVTETGKTKLVKTNFNILYQKDKQSIVEFIEKDIYIDNSGNHSPIYGVLFGGYLGSLKAGDLLPMDYWQTIKEN